MAKFEEAYFKAENKNIGIKDYMDKLHYERIYCPECFKAPLHIVRKQDKFPYYASNSKQEHLEDCQHYEDFIVNKKLNKLVESNNKDDKNRLEFLIKNNLQGAINLLVKNEKREINFTKNHIKKQSNTSFTTSSNKYKNESISRVSIKRLLVNKEEYLNNYIIIWGNADIESKEYEREISKTKEKFSIKRLNFKVNGNFRFSISITGNKLDYYKDLENEIMNKNFAVFGLLKQNNNYLELKILSTKHLKYL